LTCILWVQTQKNPMAAQGRLRPWRPQIAIFTIN